MACEVCGVKDKAVPACMICEGRAAHVTCRATAAHAVTMCAGCAKTLDGTSLSQEGA
jgi:hypothetical protein